MKRKKLWSYINYFLCSSPVFALEVSLPDLMQKDSMLRPHVKSLITGSSIESKTQLLSDVESPTTFKKLNFEELTQEIFKQDAFIPSSHHFTNNQLQELFRPYVPHLTGTDKHLIFLANVLYYAGTKIYEQTHDFDHLEHAAALGHPLAQYQMFFIAYDTGKLEQAKNYLFSSASQGNSEALLTLSEAFEGYKRIGILKDLIIARLLCEEAAKLGNQKAVFNIEVATLTEGTYNSQKNFQQGVRNSQDLAIRGNPYAKKFLEGIRGSSGDALQESNDSITKKDLDFLRNFLKWSDENDEQ